MWFNRFILSLFFIISITLTSPIYSQSIDVCHTSQDVEENIKAELSGTGIGLEIFATRDKDSIKTLVLQLVPREKTVELIEFFRTTKVPIRNVLITFFRDGCLQETIIINDDLYTRLMDGLKNLKKDKASNA